MAQDYFSTGFPGIAASDTTGARGGDSGSQLRFDNLLTPPASFTLSTGAPGSEPPSVPAADPGHAVAATDPFGYLNGSDAPQIHGNSGTPHPSTMTDPWPGNLPNPTSTGLGDGHVTNGSERIRRGGR